MDKVDLIKQRKITILKVLHLASFSGNIGDNASHIGLYTILRKLGVYAEYTQLEIRDYYQNAEPPFQKFFDKRFVEQCNLFDLIIWGGGAYLDFWLPNSSTGTTFNISLELLNEIKKPLLITSVGCITGKKIPVGNTEKFEAFLNYCAKSQRVQIMFRNDGSKVHIERQFGAGLASHFHQILDNGFYYLPKLRTNLPAKREYVALNIAFDQILETGPGAMVSDVENYLANFGELIQYFMLTMNLDVCLVPHVSGDLRAINKLLQLIPDKFIRNQIMVAPFLTGQDGADFLFDVYANASLVIGNRFHTNVCALAMGKRTIGLSALSRISHIYKSVQLDKYCVNIDENWILKTKELSLELLAKSAKKHQEELIQAIAPLRRYSINCYKENLEKLSLL